MIQIYSITADIVSSKDSLKFTAGPEGKQDKNIGKNQKTCRWRTEFLKRHQEKMNVVFSPPLSIGMYNIGMQEV